MPAPTFTVNETEAAPTSTFWGVGVTVAFDGATVAAATVMESEAVVKPAALVAVTI